MTAYERAAQSQSIAADPAQSVFVTANAGSGKTKVLIDRIARLLLAGAAPSSFLCITYTKAAAAEMQRRLFERLGAWCVARDGDLRAELEVLTGGPLDAATMGKARALFARALESPGGLKIQTIHAFCERLLGRFPLEAGVPPGFDIADDVLARDLLAEAWRAIVRAGEGETGAALARFAARLPDERFQDLLNSIVQRRGDMRVFASGDAAALRAEIFKRHKAVGDAASVMRAALAPIDWGALERAEAVLAQSGANDQKAAARVGQARALGDGALDARFAAWTAIFLKDDGEARRDAPTKKARTAEPWLDLLFSDGGEQGRALAATQSLKAIERAEDAAAALVLALALDKTYARAKARSGALDFSDLIERAHALLTQADAAPWVLYKLDGGIDHILIDEGQDTSPTQWALIAPLQEEFFAGAGACDRPRTMFAVGDPKQSIYSFQGADPRQFLEELRALEARALGAERAFTAPRLDMSFRSTPEVLHAVDATFAREALGGDVPGIFDELRHDAGRENERGRVEWWPLAQKPERAPSQPWDAPFDMEPADSAPVRLANELAARARGWIEAGEAVWERGATRAMRPGDILILVRSRGALFRQLLKSFKRAGLPVAGADRMVLKEELAVEDCLTLLRVACDPADDLALACLLKSPWIGLTDDDADLFPLAHGRGEGETLHARLEAANDARYGEAREFVRALIKRAGDAPDALLAWALERLDARGQSGWERLFARLGAEARDPIDELLTRALNAHRRGPATLHAFLAQIERDEAEVKREMEAAGGAVRIMTVHGAKGLEAPVVILPDTSAGPKLRADPDLFITAEGPVFSAAKSDDDAVSAAARAQWEARGWEEYLRLLYVAMTRARDRLIVCGYADGRFKDGANERAWHALVGEAMGRIGASAETPFGEGRVLGEILKASKTPRASAEEGALPAWARQSLGELKTRGTAAPSQLHKEPPTLSPRGGGKNRFRRGLLLHGLLQRLPDVAPARRDAAARAWLAKQGAADNELAALAKEARAVIEAPAFAHAFGPDSRAEAPIVGDVKGLAIRGIVDRLVVRAGEVEIIDFKSDRPAPETADEAPEAYVLQMALYRAVLGQIFPNKIVRCALIWTEKPLLVELSAVQMEAALGAFSGG